LIQIIANAKERKKKQEVNNLTSNLLQKEKHTHTHTHTKHTEIEVKNEKDKTEKKKRDLESCGVVTQIEKAKRIFANPRETTK
jgi:ferredoxin-NADP reductase